MTRVYPDTTPHTSLLPVGCASASSRTHEARFQSKWSPAPSRQARLRSWSTSACQNWDCRQARMKLWRKKLSRLKSSTRCTTRFAPGMILKSCLGPCKCQFLICDTGALRYAWLFHIPYNCLMKNPQCMQERNAIFRRSLLDKFSPMRTYVCLFAV